jgi:lysyl-tRNA synthetase, class II
MNRRDAPKAASGQSAVSGQGAAPGQSNEASLIAARRAKADAERAAGHSPYPNQVDTARRVWVRELREHYAPALLEPQAELRYDAARVAELASTLGHNALGGNDGVQLLGRVVARRGFGQLSFLRLRDGTGELQLFAKKDELGAAFERLQAIEVADHVEARGRVVVTKTGELSLELKDIQLVSKALRPLPEKWHGLTDIELRYRQRYVDLVANPEAALTLRARSVIVQGLRDFLDRLGFLEVETPTLHPLVGGAAARPFITQHNALDLQLYLRIAPELYLKRLLVGGFERVYEIGRCYRNEGLSTRHNPEFTMLEFYQAYATYRTLLPLTEELFRHVDAFLSERFASLGYAEQVARWQAARPFTLSEPFVRLPMVEAARAALERAQVRDPIFEEIAQAGAQPAIDLGPERIERLKASSPRAEAIDWHNLRRALAKCASPGERIFVAYEYLAEPFLWEDYRSADGQKSRPVFVMDHPTEVSPLARRKDDDPAVTERFELFVHSRELCNAFSELNDPDDQAARFREQVARKQKGDAEAMDYDADYVRALEHGMPPAAGFGLGVDRVSMALTGQDSIRDVIAFPLLRPEAAG